jgi:hypothetical protein
VISDGTGGFTAQSGAFLGGKQYLDAAYLANVDYESTEGGNVGERNGNRVA